MMCLLLILLIVSHDTRQSKAESNVAAGNRGTLVGGFYGGGWGVGVGRSFGTLVVVVVVGWSEEWKYQMGKVERRSLRYIDRRSCGPTSGATSAIHAVWRGRRVCCGKWRTPNRRRRWAAVRVRVIPCGITQWVSIGC